MTQARTNPRLAWLLLAILAGPLLAQTPPPGTRCVTSPAQVGDYEIDFWEDFPTATYPAGTFPEAEWTLYEKRLGGVLYPLRPKIQAPTFLDLNLALSPEQNPISAIVSKRGVNGGPSGSLVEVSHPGAGGIGPSGREERGRWQVIAHIVPRVSDPASGDHFGLFLRVSDTMNPDEDRDLSRFGIAVQKAGASDNPCSGYDAFLQFQRAGYVPDGNGRAFFCFRLGIVQGRQEINKNVFLQPDTEFILTFDEYQERAAPWLSWVTKYTGAVYEVGGGTFQCLGHLTVSWPQIAAEVGTMPPLQDSKVMAAAVLSPALHVDLDKVYVAAWRF